MHVTKELNLRRGDVWPSRQRGHNSLCRRQCRHDLWQQLWRVADAYQAAQTLSVFPILIPAAFGEFYRAFLPHKQGGQVAHGFRHKKPRQRGCSICASLAIAQNESRATLVVMHGKGTGSNYPWEAIFGTTNIAANACQMLRALHHSTVLYSEQHTFPCILKQGAA